MAPFKDYNNKVQLTIQGMSGGGSVTFTSNFRPNLGWGECFGNPVWGLNISTTQKGDMYETTIFKQGLTFDLTKPCDIMGTNSGTAEVFPGVAVPIITAVNIDGSVLKINQPCQATGCKDPGNGFAIGGYYAQWAVWGRQFNPYAIPFDTINQIFYAFIGFNPGDGSIKTLDSSADGWGMSAISRALLQYPYLQAHLSFGGWTNNGQTTAPMFEQLASSQASMERFATQSVELMRKLGFSGIDIDWEWWSDFSNDVAPAKKTLAFYQILRKALNDASSKDGKKYRLSTAVNGGMDRALALQKSTNPNSIADFWKQVGAIVDQVNIMNYDYHGGYDVGNPAYFQATYDFPNVGDNKVGKDEGWSIKNSVETYIANGIKSRQIVVGIPLYARTMQVSSSINGGIFAKVIGTGFGDYEQGILDYKCIMNPVGNPATGCGSSTPVAAVKSMKFYNSGNNTDTWNLYGKDALQVWGYSTDAASFVTFDNVWTTQEKVKIAKSKQLLGVMFWELDGDSQTVSESLIHTAKNQLNLAEEAAAQNLRTNN
jgi:chitinase